MKWNQPAYKQWWIIPPLFLFLLCEKNKCKLVKNISSVIIPCNLWLFCNRHDFEIIRLTKPSHYLSPNSPSSFFFQLNIYWHTSVYLQNRIHTLSARNLLQGTTGRTVWLEGRVVRKIGAVPEGQDHPGLSWSATDCGFYSIFIKCALWGIHLFICVRVHLFFQDIVSLSCNGAGN